MTRQNGTRRTVGAAPRRPRSIGRGVKQIAVLVRDRSGSMSGRKAADASAASRDLVQELARKANQDGFIVSVVDFDDTAGVIHAPQAATRLRGKVKPIQVRGGTNITAGLRRALRILQAAEADRQADVTYLRPVVLCFTDGEHNTGPSPRTVAARLKKVADLVTVAFGADADERLLRALATSSQHFYRCRKGRELRTFLAAVGVTLTGTLTRGVNATQALGAIEQ